jgi:hypothetical protein
MTEIFGQPRIVVFKEPYKLFQSETISDLGVFTNPATYSEKGTGNGVSRTQTGTMTDEELAQKVKEGAKTYKEFKGRAPYKDKEIIADAGEYWLINKNAVWAGGGKFVPDSVKPNYGGLVTLLSHFKKNMTWIAKNRDFDTQVRYLDNKFYFDR